MIKFSKNSFETAIQFHIWHSLALLGIAWFCETRSKTDGGGIQAKWGHRAGFLFVIGMVLFCGKFYALGLNKIIPMAGLAPAVALR